MKGKIDGAAAPPAMSRAAKEWAQPWWLHAPVDDDHAAARTSRNARREFTGMAAQIALAAWMLGTALTSSCATLERLSGTTTAAARTANLTAGAPASAPATDGRPELMPVAIRR